MSGFIQRLQSVEGPAQVPTNVIAGPSLDRQYIPSQLNGRPIVTPKLVVPLLVAAGILISACDDTATSSPPAGNSAETAARSACLNAVIGETGNPDTAVLSSDFSEAGTMVRVGVGSQRAP